MSELERVKPTRKASVREGDTLPRIEGTEAVDLGGVKLAAADAQRLEREREARENAKAKAANPLNRAQRRQIAKSMSKAQRRDLMRKAGRL